MESKIGYDKSEFRFCSSELVKKNMIDVKLVDDFNYDQAAKTFDNERKVCSVHAADGKPGEEGDAAEEAARRGKEERARAHPHRKAQKNRVSRRR